MVHIITSGEGTTVSFAAGELEKYVNQIPNAVGFPTIELRVEQSCEQDAYRVNISPEGGQIAGTNSRSLLLGVYDYLRHLGFRFLHPGPDGTYVPREVTEESVYQVFEEKTRFHHRGICIEGADSLENVLDMIDWLPKAGFSSFFIQFREPYFFLERWYDHVKNDLIPSEQKPDTFYRECYRKIRAACSLRAVQIHGVGHGFTAEALGYPSIGWIPAEKAPDEKTRALIALVNGQRVLVDDLPLNTNLCYANPTARRKLCDAVLTYAREHRDVSYLHVWLADDYNHICECEECKKTTPTDQYVSILNEIDELLTKENLSCKIVFLLYQELLYPPVKERIRNPGRFSLMFAPISRTFEQSYPAHPEKREIAPYVRNHMKLPVDIHENLAYLTAWKKTFQGDSFVYDYPLGKAHYGDFGYQRISKTLYEDIRRLSSLDLNGYMSCQELRASFPTGLPNFVMGRALQDEAASFEEIQIEYFEAAYGEAYPAAQSYLEEISRLSSMDYFIGIGPRVDENAAKQYEAIEVFTGKEKEHLTEVLSSARLDALNEEMQHRHWELLILHTDYCQLLAKACRLLAEGNPNSREAYEAFTEFVKRNEMRTQSFLDTYRIQEVTGKYTGF